MTGKKIIHSFELIVALFILPLFLPGRGQVFAQQYPVQKYGTYEGLSNFGVIHLHQDRNGSVWMGTYWGINFLSKERRIIYHKQLSALPDDFMDYVEITSSPNGTVWAAGDRLYRFESDQNEEIRAKIYSIPFNSKRERPSAQYLTADQEGRVWFSSRTDRFHIGCRLYRWQNNEVTDVTRRYFADSNQRFRGLQADWTNHRLLILTEEGQLWELRDQKLLRLAYPIKINRLLQNPVGKIYCFADSALYQFEGRQLRRLYQLPTSTRALTYCAIGLNNDLVFANREQHICWYDGKKLTNSLLPIASQSHFMVDRQNNIWVATLNGAIQVMRNGWQYYENAKGRSDQVMSIAEDASGTVWFSTWGNGLARLLNHSILIDSTYFQTAPTKHFYSATHRDTDGNLFFSPARSPGFLWYDGKKYSILPGSKDGAIARGFYDDVRNNRYIFSTQKGLYLYNRSTLALDRIIRTPGGESYDIEVDKYGRLWSGGFDTTYVWDSRHNKIHWLTTSQEFPFKRVYDIQRDFAGNLWFATDRGLWFYNYKEYRRIGSDYLQRVVMFCRPLGRFFLLGTVEGLYVFDGNRFYRTGEEWLAFFDRENGFIGNQCIPNGIFRDSHARWWVATRDRVMVIQERHLQHLLKPVPVGIRSFRDLRTGQVIEAEPEESRFHSYQNDLEVHLWEPDETNMLANSTYIYRLERLDDSSTIPAWSAPVRSSSIFLKNLSDGRYQLTVKVIRAQGLWNTQPLVSQFVIAPPWWTTWWARTLFALAIAICLFYWRLWQVRTRANRRQQILEAQRRLTQLELEAATREKHEAQMQQELAEAARRRALLEVKAITNQIDPHFISNFLTAIQSVMYEQDTQTAAGYLAKFGAIFRSQLLSRSRVFWSLREELDFVRNYLSLEHLRFGDRINFTINLSPGVPLDTSLPKMLIQGYVSNAIKHGLEHQVEGGTIQIDIHQENGCLLIRVDDNGVGLEKSKLYRRHSTGQGLVINQAVFNQLNQYNTQESWQRLTDLTDHTSGSTGVRMEACLPVYPTLPPEENMIVSQQPGTQSQ